MTVAPPNQPDAPSYADRLRGVTVRLRDDLEVSRHVFHGEANYIIRDPITFQSHQVSPEDYDILVALRDDRTLGEIFEHFIGRERMERRDEEDFYELIVQLHRLGFLTLPVSDDRALYQRFLRRKKLERRGLLMSAFIFFRIPLYNPDALLDRTIHLGRLLFTRTAFVLWMILMAAATVVAWARRDDLAAPLLSILDAQNLALLWIQLVGLKVIHEFGHAYACKRYGGHVPEMGVLLIAFTPCAYVDATAAWGFVRKRERIMVCLAGMYVESVIAAIALFAWAASDVGGLNTFAYQTFLLASVVTVGFNLNPLMRYDGYYVLSDLIDMPNLRRRASRELQGVVNRRLLGLPDPRGRYPRWTWITLLVYGVASAIYKVVLVTSICAVIATKFFLLGLLLAAIYLTTTLIGAVAATIRHLWLSPVTAPVRGRAIALSVLLFGAIPAGVALAPLPRPVEAAGVVAPDDEHIVRASADGFLAAVRTHPKDAVRADDPLVVLTHPATENRVDVVAARRDLAALRVLLLESTDRAQAEIERERLTVYEREYEDAAADQRDLTIRAPQGGLVLACRDPRELGAFIAKGDEIARITSGGVELRVLARAELLADSTPQPGDQVWCRTVARPDDVIPGRIVSIAPAGARTIDEPALTAEGGGSIVIDQDRRASEAYFDIRIAFDPPTDQPAPDLRPGMTMQVRFDAAWEPIGDFLTRRLQQFLQRLRLS